MHNFHLETAKVEKEKRNLCSSWICKNPGSETFSISSCETDEQTVLPNFDRGKVHSVPGSFKLLVGKLLSDLDTNNDNTISYFEQWRKITGSFFQIWKK